jgi:hypothetical protein
MRGPNGVVVAMGGRRSFYLSVTMHAAAGEAPMTHDIGLDRRYLDLVVFPDQFHLGVGRHRPAA